MYGRTGRLTAQNGDFRRGQEDGTGPSVKGDDEYPGWTCTKLRDDGKKAPGDTVLTAGRRVIVDIAGTNRKAQCQAGGNDWQKIMGDSTHDRVAKPRTPCLDCEYESDKGRVDTISAGGAVCGTWYIEDRTCVKCKTCTDEEYETQTCTSVANRVCTALSTCAAATHYQTNNPLKTTAISLWATATTCAADAVKNVDRACVCATLPDAYARATQVHSNFADGVSECLSAHYAPGVQAACKYSCTACNKCDCETEYQTKSCTQGTYRARSHCRFVLLFIRFTPDSLTYSVPLFLKGRCDRTLGLHRRRAAQRRRPGALR